MQYHYKYAFFEIFTNLKSDFTKNYSIIDLKKTELNPALNEYKTEPINDPFSDTFLRKHGLI